MKWVLFISEKQLLEKTDQIVSVNPDNHKLHFEFY